MGLKKTHFSRDDLLAKTIKCLNHRPGPLVYCRLKAVFLYISAYKYISALNLIKFVVR